MNHLNEVLNPHNLVPGPGTNAMAPSVTGTIGRTGTNGVRCHLSGAGVVRYPVNGTDFNTRGLNRGLSALVNTVMGTGPTTTGNRCVHSITVASAVNPDIHVGPTGFNTWLGMFAQ